MNQLMLSNVFDIIEGFPTVDLQTGANTGDWISLKNANRVAVVFMSGVGTDGDDPTLTIEQAKDVSDSGGVAKALNFTTIYRKQAATSLAAVDAWTVTTQSAGNTYTNTDAAQQDLIWVVEFDPSELDVANGFTCIRATVADVGGAAQPGALLYLVSPKSATSPATPMSYIAD